MSTRIWNITGIVLIAAVFAATILVTQRSADTQYAMVLGAFGALSVLYLLHLLIHQRTVRGLAKKKAELEGKLAERKKESESVLQSTIDGISDPVLFLDTDYRVTMSNEAARKAFDVEADAKGAVNCHRAMHGFDAPCDPAVYPCTLRTGKAGKVIQTRVDDEGLTRHVEIRTTPLRSEAGEIIGAVEVTHDLNEHELIALALRRAKEDAETASRAKSDFVATMSHDVRTPMNSVLGMTDLLQLTKLSRKQQNYVRIIQSSGDMLLSLVENMLDFSKLEAGQLVLEKCEFDVVRLLESVLEMTGYSAYAKELELAGSIRQDSLLLISADLQHLRQIVINIVSNAIKFTDQGEVLIKIEVDADADGKASMSVAVSDSGIGISGKAKAMLFTPFARPEQAASTQQQGSGLGLTICKQLVEKMGGEIAVESELGQGTHVRFRVPVDVISTSEPSIAYPTLALKDRRALVVHDNSKVAAIICGYLQTAGMKYEIASSGDDVPGRLRDAASYGQEFDCTVIDMDLRGDTNGLSLAQGIRADKAAEKLPIILLTPIARPLKVGKISAIGSIRCVDKPVLPSQLWHNMCRAMGVDESVAANDVAESDRDLRILVAEDNPVSRGILVGMLKSLNYLADYVEDGPSVLSALADNPFDLVLMDCQMPGMDGDQVTKELRQNTRLYRQQPIVVAVSADASAEHKSRCLRAGMDDFLTKPIRLEMLRRRLHQWSSLLGKSPAEASVADAGPTPGLKQDLFAQLRDRAGVGGRGFVKNYIDLFLDDTATRLEILRAALERQDHATLRRESHALKGACLEFGITRMGERCDALRDASRARRSDNESAALDGLRQEFERLRPVFEAEKNRRA
jgi:signal transduction histidine kinase/DNA-binding response OmpR family regulator/HPt (histidine-containing phosphotransfer) domain-containing protein